MRTIETLNRQVKELRDKIAKGECVTGAYGLDECKKSVIWESECFHKTIEQIYAEEVALCITRPLHNEMMLVACEEIINENKEEKK